MTKDNMTIRFAPDGFSFIDCSGASSSPSDDATSPRLSVATSALLDDAPFHEVAPGPDYQQRLHEAVLNVLPEGETPLDLTVQVLSERVVILPPDTDPDLATSMYHVTLSDLDEPEQVLLQPITLPSGQRVTLCFGIDRQLYLFLERNCGDLRFEHHIASLLHRAAPSAAPSSSSLRPQVSPSQPFMAAHPAPSSQMSLSQPSMAAPSASQACLATMVTPQFLELALFRSSQLVLAKVYRTSQAGNRRYYVLNTWLREGLDQLNDLLLILGKGDPASQLHQDLQPFIKQINRNY